MSTAERSPERRDGDAIDRFIDAVWIEDGLAPNTLAAYRRDLSLLADWLRRHADRTLDEARETDLRAYAVARHAGCATPHVSQRPAVKPSSGGS